MLLLCCLLSSILNKLTPEKFDKLCLELLNVGIESKLVLKGIILLVRILFILCSCTCILTYRNWHLIYFLFFSPKIVDKALEEPKYSQLYAQLCLRLAEDAPNFEEPSSENPATQKQNTVRFAQEYGLALLLSGIVHFGFRIFCFVLQTFRRLLISKLQDEFENRARNVERE